MSDGKRCPNVWAKIAEAKELLAAGACWCDCVHDDIPNAELKVGEGKCGAANSIISAALRRCDRTKLQGTVAPVAIVPIAPINILGD